MKSVNEWKTWLANNKDADDELTAHRLRDLVRSERKEAMAAFAVWEYTKHFVIAIAGIAIAVLGIYALTTIGSTASDEAVIEARQATEACQKQFKATSLELRQEINKLKQDEAAVDAYATKIVDACYRKRAE